MKPPEADPAVAELPGLEDALEALFAAPFPQFVEERKRLVTALRVAKHKAAATALAKVNRPTLASWAINQLVRAAPDEVSAMFTSAARVRLGDFAAAGEHRQVLAKLGALATELLRAHELPTSEATLRRIATSLQALSAYGDFAPDQPGRMIADRDPPGFDSMALLDGSAGAAAPLALPKAEGKATTEGDEAKGAATQDATKLPVLPKPTPMLRLVPPPVAEAVADPDPDPVAEAVADSDSDIYLREAAEAEAAADAQAAAEAEAAERAVAAATAALAAAQASAKAAAARVQLARQRSLLEETRTRQRRAASAIYDHEQAIALMQRELEQRQVQLRQARLDAEALQTEIERLTAVVEELSGAAGPSAAGEPSGSPRSS